MKRSSVIIGAVGCLVLLALDAAIPQVSHRGGNSQARLSGSCYSVADRQITTLSVGDVRVRNGGQIRVDGVRQAIFVDAGGVADVLGSGATIYVAKGGKATVGGERNQVVAELGASVFFLGRPLMTVVETIDLQVHKNGSDCQ
jgi:hypothetical protein